MPKFLTDLTPVQLFNSILTAVASVLFFFGWWIMVDVNVQYRNVIDFNKVYHLPGIVGTLAMIFINTISSDLLYDRGSSYGCCSPSSARLCLLFALTCSFGCVIGACFILINDFLLDQSKYQWPGYGIFIQNIFIFACSIIMRFCTALKLHNWADNHLQPISVYKPKNKPFGSSSKLVNISWCHDNGYIALLQSEGQPQILSSKDRTNLNLVHTIQAVRRTSSLSFKRHTKRILALGNEDGEVVLYDTKNRNVSRRVTNLGSPVKHLEFNSTDERLAVATDRALYTFSDSESTNNFVKEADYPEKCASITFHPHCPHLLAAGNYEGSTTLRDLEKEEIVTKWQKHSAAVTGASFASNQKVVVTTGLDHKICVHDYCASESVFRMNLHQPVTTSALSGDDSYIAVGLEDGYVYVYDLRDPLKPLACEKSHSSPVSAIAFERHLPMFNRPSVTTLTAESDYGENRSETPESMGDKRECFENRLKRELLKSVKTHVGYLEGQLAEHCAKFQIFVNNEFEAIHCAMARWDVFNIADTCDDVAVPLDANTVKSMSNK